MTETQTVDLAAWLTAIWDEEERGIREALKTGDYGVSQFDLDRLAADRKILELHTSVDVRTDGASSCASCAVTANWELDPEDWPCPTVRLLASPYADREGFQEAWRV